MAEQDPLLLLAPLKPQAKFAGGWVLDQAEIKGHSDVLYRFSNGDSGETLTLWLTRREDRAPHYSQSASFNMTYISTVPGSPSPREKEAVDLLVRTVRENDKGEIVLLRKEDPYHLVLSRGGRLDTLSIGTSSFLLLAGLLAVAAVVYWRAAKKWGEEAHRWVEWGMLALTVLVAAVLRFHGLGDLGPESLMADEARIGLGALSILKYKTLILNYASPHEPPLSLYYPLPFLYLLGNHVWVLRLAPALAGVLSVLFTYGFAREFFNRQVAILMAVAMAVSPLSVTFSRILYEHSFMPLLTTAFLFGFARFVRTQSHRFLALAGLAAGIGLSTKIIFLYFLVAFAAAFFLTGYFRKVAWSKRNLLVFAGSFFVGSLPILLYALAPGSEFFSAVLGASGLPWRADLSAALSEREHLARTAFTPWLVPVMVLWIAYFIVRRRLNREILFFLVMYPVLYLESLVTISGVGLYHFMVFLPIPYAFFAGVLHEFRVKKAFVVPIAVVFLLYWGVSRNWRQPSGLYGSNLSNQIIPVLTELPPSESIAMHHDLSYIQYFLHSGRGLPSIHGCGIITFERRGPDAACPAGISDDLENRFRKLVNKSKGRKISIDDYDATEFGPTEDEAIRDTVTELIEAGQKRFFLFPENPESPRFDRMFAFVYPSVKRTLEERGVKFQERRVSGPKGRASLRVIRIDRP